jgi:hypothetical protein
MPGELPLVCAAAWPLMHQQVGGHLAGQGEGQAERARWDPFLSTHRAKLTTS